jgi:type VI secretion system secreted protein VgrG
MPGTPNAPSSQGGNSGGGGGGGGSGSYTQTNRPLMVHTPLGADKLLLTGFSGREAISQLFSFHLDAIADIKTPISFDGLLGQKVTACLQLPDASYRYFNGIVIRVTEGGRDNLFTDYGLEIVPQFWLLTKKTHSRMFKQMTVPDILKAVLAGLNVSYKIQGTFEPRNYCVQYRETDFNFASRLMAEEGIYYYFEHSDGDHQMVVANTPASHAPLATGSSIIFEGMDGGTRSEDRIYSWTKTQELRAGKTVLWDYNFELPHKNLDATTIIQSSVPVGTMTHNLQAGNNDTLELFDFPGNYAQRFDGVDPGGGQTPANLQKIFADNTRTAGIRMEEEAFSSIVIQGRSGCRQMNSGHKFTFTRHPNANGDYVLHSVSHAVRLDSYRTNDSDFDYSNTFSAFPFELPFRPPWTNNRQSVVCGNQSAAANPGAGGTQFAAGNPNAVDTQSAAANPNAGGIQSGAGNPNVGGSDCCVDKAAIWGTQTATVVGNAGEEISADIYGRVKVQFAWDQAADMSRWARVMQPTAGNRWGTSFWPRVGQEVVVAFEHGNPDYPIILGSVYGPAQPPPYLGGGPDPKHSNDPKVSGFKSCSTTGGGGYNELRFDDTKGSEEVFIHAQRNLDVRVENDAMVNIGNDLNLTVGGQSAGVKKGNKNEEIYQNEEVKIHKDRVEWIGGCMYQRIGGIDGGVGDQYVDIGSNRKQSIDKDDGLLVGGSRTSVIARNESLTVGVDRNIFVSGKNVLHAVGELHLQSDTKLIIDAPHISIVVGGSFVDITPTSVSIVGAMVNINSGGSPGSGSACSPAQLDLFDPNTIQPTKPVQADNSVTGNVSG